MSILSKQASSTGSGTEQMRLSDYEVIRMLNSEPVADSEDLEGPQPADAASGPPLTATIDAGTTKITSFADAGMTFLRVPMIYTGEWVHNGDPLVIDETWMDAVLRNYENNALGYRPPLFLGHPRNVLSEEGAPAEGFLVKLERQGNQLIGIFECVSPETAEAVENSRYRHASIEFAEIRDKHTGEFLGPAIVGCALTNRPFIPNLESPTVFRLGDELYSCTDSRLTVVVQMEKISPSADAPMTPSTIDNLRSDFEGRVAQIEAAYSTRLSELEERFTSLSERHDAERTELLSQIASLQAKLAEAEAEVAAKKLSEKLDRLDRMMLSDDIKAEYAKMLSSGELGGAEERVLATLEKQSEFNRRALTQFGSVSTAVQPVERKAPSAFSHIIDRNKARRSNPE